MATWTPATKNSSTFANQNKSTVGSVVIPIGTAMGLLLALTYATEVTISSGSAPDWTEQTKN